MGSELERRIAEQCQSLGGGMKAKPEKKRSKSLDEITFGEHVILKFGSREGELKKAVTVSLDDCSVYVTFNSKHERQLKVGGTKSFDEMSSLPCKPLDKARCICHLLPRGKSPEFKPCYDLVASPGPKFLSRKLDLPDSPSASFKINASVPFKWEEAPGKPRPDAAIGKPDRSLRLPPRLLAKTSTSDCTLPDWPKPLQARSVSQNRERRSASMEWREKRMSCTPLIFRSAELSASITKTKSVSCPSEAYSPRSILNGPVANSTSSSSDPNSLSDSETGTREVPIKEIWSDLADQAEITSSLVETENLNSNPERQMMPCVEYHLKDLAPSPEPETIRNERSFVHRFKAVVKFFSTSRRSWQRGSKKYKTRSFSKTELWAPTLATYFQFLEQNKLNAVSEKLRLLDNVEKSITFEKDYEELFSSSITDDTASESSLSPECICQCQDRKEQTDHLSEESTKNDLLTSKHVNLFNKQIVGADLPGRCVRPNASQSRSRLLLLFPSQKRRNMKHEPQNGGFFSRSFNAIKHAFISKTQDHGKPSTHSNLLYGCVQA